jgi:cytochrome c553
VKITIPVAALLGLLFPTTMLGAGDPNAAKSIVAEYCVKCHAVPGYTKGGAPKSVQAPSFESIANNPDIYTAEGLRAFLQQPHYPMKSVTLSDSDISNLIAFIATLRK